MKEEQDRLLKEQWELEQIESERKNVEAERQQQEFGSVVFRESCLFKPSSRFSLRQDLFVKYEIFYEILSSGRSCCDNMPLR